MGKFHTIKQIPLIVLPPGSLVLIENSCAPGSLVKEHNRFRAVLMPDFPCLLTRNGQIYSDRFSVLVPVDPFIIRSTMDLL